MNEEGFLYNSFGRLRSGWRFLVFVIVFIFAFIAANTAVHFGLIGIGIRETELSIYRFVFANLATLLLTIGLAFFCGRFFEELPFKALGISMTKNWLKNLILGIIYGVASISTCCLISIFFGGLSLEFNSKATTYAMLTTFAISFVVFTIGAANEEVIFRGYILQTLSRAKLAWLAILLTSFFFANGHYDNPNATAISLLNTGLAGIWFGVAYLKTRDLWFPIGIHFMWNWVQGAFLGIPVSGITEITKNPLLTSSNQGQVWITGGSYGLEGGIACTFAIALCTAAIWFAPFLKADEELFALSSKEKPVNTVI